MSARHLANHSGLRLHFLSQTHPPGHVIHPARTSLSAPVSVSLYPSSVSLNAVVHSHALRSTSLFISPNVDAHHSPLTSSVMSSSITSSYSDTNCISSAYSLTSVSTTRGTLTCSLSTSALADDIFEEALQEPSDTSTTFLVTSQVPGALTFESNHWTYRVTPTNPVGVTAREQVRFYRTKKHERAVLMGLIAGRRAHCAELFADPARLEALAQVTAGEKGSEEELALVAAFMDHLEQWKQEQIPKVRAHINDRKRIRKSQWSEEQKQRVREYVARNRERLCARRRQVYAEGYRERARMSGRASAARNIEQVRATWKRYYLQNKESLKARRAEYIRLNRDKYLARVRELSARRRAAMTPEQREQENERVRLRRLLPNPNWTPEQIARSRERQLQKYRDYIRKNAEKVKLRTREYREANREKLKERSRQYRERNREKLREMHRQYRLRNADKIREWRRQYYERNPHALRDLTARRREKEQGYTREERKSARREAFPRLLAGVVLC